MAAPEPAREESTAAANGSVHQPTWEELHPRDRKYNIRRFVLVSLAALLMAVNTKTFVRTGGLYPGGVAGITLLIQRSLETYAGISIPYFVINYLLNSIPVYIGLRFIGRRFTLFSLWLIVLNGFLTDLIPAHVITYDTLLISIFGGMINGLGVSLCLRADATSGGTDFLAIYLSQKKGVDTFNLMLLLNCGVLTVAGLLFGWDRALYSIIFQFVSTQVVHALYRTYQQQTLFIVTRFPNEVSAAIHDECHHGATIIKGEGAYRHGEQDVVYSVISGAESRQVIRVVQQIDPAAFINSVRTSEVRGNFYLRPRD